MPSALQGDVVKDSSNILKHEMIGLEVQIYDDMIYSTRYYNFPERQASLRLTDGTWTGSLGVWCFVPPIEVPVRLASTMAA